MPIISFLRYPGSKRRMIEFLRQHLPTANKLRQRYVEPFVGGGAVFFMVNPEKALLSDVNPELIDLYCGIKQSPDMVWERYCGFGSGKTDYFRIRDNVLSEKLVDRAARTLFLNRTCFKGMWRHNKNGRFNVGYGGQHRRWVINLADLVAVGRTLRKAELRCCDFEEVIATCQTGDFIFADPPYRPGERDLINDHYSSAQFTFMDHRRLALALQDAKKRGVMWALTTSTHPDIVGLFTGAQVIEMPQGTGRQPGVMVANSGEVLITSYPRGAWKG